MEGFGKILILCGVILVALGVLMSFAGKIPFLGKLPGDILIKRENFTFYFPLATSVLLSVVISLILYLLGKR